jgi:formylglycine-generating enzyme required for sulfatase activity
LTVRLEGYLPLEVIFEDFGIKSLIGKTVYVLTLSGVTGAQHLEAPKTKTGWIVLDSEPSGASVYINDEFVGNTPLSNYKQAYGTYQYRLEHPNYHSSTGTIELNAGRFEQKVILKPAFGSVSVNSSIAGAKILLDGKQTGKQTPAMLTEIPSGTHTITLQMDKYAPIQQEVTVEDGKTANVSMTLDARFARITVNSLDGAEIYSNGKLIGKGRISEDMMEGYYDLEARLDHHKSVTKQIQVIAGKAQDITLNPVPKYGSLDIVSEPHNSVVLIDGKEMGTTPLTVEEILEGEHTIRIKKESYIEELRVVGIKSDKTEQLIISLKEKKFDISYSDDAQTFTIGDVQFKMVKVEGGTFEWKGPRPLNINEVRTSRSVTLSGYFIGATEVTQGLWEIVMGNNPSEFKGKNRPVESVTWNDCQTFISKLNAITGLNFRLPTRAEWEFAAQGGNKSKVEFKYSGSNNIDDVAWYGRGDGTRDVGTKYPNELGLYDMSGNVWEWCNDWWSDVFNGKSHLTNPTGPEKGYVRVICGGAWNNHCFDIDMPCVDSREPLNTGNVFGFRLAL